MLLAGDIGGTKTDLAIYALETGPRQPLAQATLPSADYASLDALARDFLAQAKLPVEKACFGVAGPVVNGQAAVTNLPWVIAEGQLAESLGAKAVKLLNDLEAIGYAVPNLAPDDVATLIPGQPQPHGPIAIVAPGTGLGVGYLTWDGGRYGVHASEGGHATFAPNSDLELGLSAFLRQRFDHVSYERVCSGRGMPNLYAYLKETGLAAEEEWLSARLAGADDPTPIIVQAALDATRPSPLCRQTLELFVSILGGLAGNLALTTLADGGVYVAGGIPPRITPFLQGGVFRASFLNKGRLAYVIERMPVHLVLNPKAALLGAACYVLSM